MEIPEALRFASRDTFVVEHGDQLIHVNDRGIGLLVRAYKSILHHDNQNIHRGMGEKRSSDMPFYHGTQSMHRGLGEKRSGDMLYYNPARNTPRHMGMQSARPSANDMYDRIPQDGYASGRNPEDMFRRTTYRNDECYPPPEIAHAIDILSNRLYSMYK